MLVLSFTPDIEHAAAERCAAWSGPAGQVTAAVCDQFGGKAGFSVVVGHRSRARSYRRTDSP
jgi:hypothetical protein